MSNNSINIRPGVGYLSILSAINYTPWHATAEFVDNSIQSYIDNKTKLRKLHSNYKLKIEIYVSGAVIEIKDNAGGINKENHDLQLFGQCSFTVQFNIGNIFDIKKRI